MCCQSPGAFVPARYRFVVCPPVRSLALGTLDLSSTRYLNLKWHVWILYKRCCFLLVRSVLLSGRQAFARHLLAPRRIFCAIVNWLDITTKKPNHYGMICLCFDIVSASWLEPETCSTGTPCTVSRATWPIRSAQGVSYDTSNYSRNSMRCESTCVLSRACRCLRAGPRRDTRPRARR